MMRTFAIEGCKAMNAIIFNKKITLQNTDVVFTSDLSIISAEVISSIKYIVKNEIASLASARRNLAKTFFQRNYFKKHSIMQNSFIHSIHNRSASKKNIDAD